MARSLVRHAVQHFEFFQAHTDRLLARRNPESGGTEITIQVAKPLDSGNELALDMEVKHCVEDLRSALEYTAMEVYEECCCRDPEDDHVHRNVTFPIPTLDMTDDEYAGRVDTIFPGLRANNAGVFAIIAQCKRFASGNEVWLDTLHSVWSEVKHRRLGRDSKPMKVLVPGIDPSRAPSVMLYYFPGSTRAVDPNIGGAIREIGSLVDAVDRALTSQPPATTEV